MSTNVAEPREDEAATVAARTEVGEVLLAIDLKAIGEEKPVVEPVKSSIPDPPPTQPPPFEPPPTMQPPEGMKTGTRPPPPMMRRTGPASHSANAEKLQPEVKKTVADKILGPVGTGLDPAVGTQFVAGMEKMLATSPKISEHFQKLFGDKATLRFDAKAESAFFDSKENQIIMPGKKGPPKPGTKPPLPPDPQDLVDAFLFESCNVERAADYVDLHKTFMDKLDTEPKSFAAYGAAKAKIECEATTKQAQLLFNLFDKGGDLAPAGKRNLLMTGGLVLAHAAKSPVPKVGAPKAESHAVSAADLKEFKEFRNQLNALNMEKAEVAKLPAEEQGKKAGELAKKSAAVDSKVDELLAKHKDLLRDGLPLIDSNPELNQAVLTNFSESCHNVNKGKPTDKGNLKTKEMYAFEQMESLKEPELIKLIKTALKKALPPEAKADIKNNWGALSEWMDSTLRNFELDETEPHARQKIVLDIVNKLEADFPESKGKLSETFGFTTDMKDVAEARFEEMKKQKPAAWDAVKDAHLPPIKGWAGKLPIPLSQVATKIPPGEVNEKMPKSKHRDALQQTAAKDRELLQRVVGAKEGKANFNALPNAEAGVNTSFQIKAADGKETVALFKPLSPGGASTGEKLAPCLKKHGAKETREVACSAWNEFCGGLGDYPVTVPADFDGQKGSVMAWRNGAKELSAYNLSEVEEKFAGDAGAALVKLFEENPNAIEVVTPKKGKAFKVSLDGRLAPPTPVPPRDPLDTSEPVEPPKEDRTTRVAAEVKKECDESMVRKKAELKVLIETADEEAAQDLMALHVATLQMDAENSCNVMFAMADGKMKPFAIDGGLSAPDQIYASDLKNPCWCEWPQANKPWTPEQIKKFEAIDVNQAAEKLKEHMEKSPVGDLEKDSVLRMMASTQALKLTAKAGFSPKLTWNFIQGLEKLVVDASEIAKANKTDFLKEFTTLAQTRIEDEPWTDDQKMKAADKKIDEKISQIQKKLAKDAEFVVRMKAALQSTMSKAAAGMEGEMLTKLTWRFSEEVGRLIESAAEAAKKGTDILEELNKLAEEKIKQIVAEVRGMKPKKGATEDFKIKEDIAKDAQADKAGQQQAKQRLEEMLKKATNQ